MFRRTPKVYLTLNHSELRMLRFYLIEARNKVLSQGGPTEDLDRLIIKISK